MKSYAGPEIANDELVAHKARRFKYEADSLTFSPVRRRKLSKWCRGEEQSMKYQYPMYLSVDILHQQNSPCGWQQCQLFRSIRINAPDDIIGDMSSFNYYYLLLLICMMMEDNNIINRRYTAVVNFILFLYLLSSHHRFIMSNDDVIDDGDVSPFKQLASAATKYIWVVASRLKWFLFCSTISASTWSFLRRSSYQVDPFVARLLYFLLGNLPHDFPDHQLHLSIWWVYNLLAQESF